MENWDEYFSTLKGAPRFSNAKPRTLSSWKPDIPLGDGDLTLTRKAKLPSVVDLSDDFADDFEDSDRFEGGLARVESKRPTAEYEDKLPEAFLSDSSVKSPSRASVSSAASSSSVATSWDNDDDFGFDFDEDEMPGTKLDLAARFKAHQDRAAAESAAEANQMAANYARTIRKKTASRNAERSAAVNDDDILDAELEQLTLRVKNGTVNQNVKLQPSNKQPQSSAKLLRGMRSIAQLPRKRSEVSLPPPPRLRGAVSMADIGSQPHKAQSSSMPTQRPLTAYREPSKKPTKIDPRRSKSKKPNLIRNAAGNLKPLERNGMVLNPETGMWEGNEVDASRFDMLMENGEPTVKPRLITKQSLDPVEHPMPNGMLFDSRTLSWVYANEDEYDDPFAALDDPDTDYTPVSTPSPVPQAFPFQSPSASMHSVSPSMNHLSSRVSHRASRKFTNQSLASTASFASSQNFGRTSVKRSETSGREVFEVSARMAAEWHHADERFIRKFGKWVGSEEERADALQSDKYFYEMVRNA